MKLAKFWSKVLGTSETKAGQALELVCWGGSDESNAAAAEKAEEKLQRLISYLREGKDLDRYTYLTEHLIREQIIEERLDDAGNRIVAITRNRYGALVLNAASVLFADVDLPKPPPRSLLASLLGLFRKSTEDEFDAHQIVRDHFAHWHSIHPEWNIRVYQTAAGYRGLVLNQSFDPGVSETMDLLREVHSDKLYIKLCKAQSCFRARLTPKPWRIEVGYSRLALDPDIDGRQTPEVEEWLHEYEQDSRDYTVCKLVDEYGPTDITEHARIVVDIHDRYVLNNASDVLA